ncbi:MAG: hypothetical protein WAK53_16055 [Chromatiaceae bacterium]
MSWLGLIGGFLLFMGLIGVAHALDRQTAERFAYRPFAIPNLAFMLLPHGVLVAFVIAWRQGAWDAPVPALALGAFALAALLFMGVILWRRTSMGIALAATGLMVVGAPILLLSTLFRELAESAPGG